MIKTLSKLPKKLTVAVSGGVDSMAIVDFLGRCHDIQLAFFHHGTQTSNESYEFITEFSMKKNLKLFIGEISKRKEKNCSLEEHWRNERYDFLHSFDGKVVTGHNLDDSIETWIWSSLHGNPKLIPLERKNIIRPFLTTEKKDLIYWCKKYNVKWQEDLTNNDTKFTRNYIRHDLMPHALHVNPGLSKMIRKKIISKYQTLS